MEGEARTESRSGSFLRLAREYLYLLDLYQSALRPSHPLYLLFLSPRPLIVLLRLTLTLRSTFNNPTHLHIPPATSSTLRGIPNTFIAIRNTLPRCVSPTTPNTLLDLPPHRPIRLSSPIILLCTLRRLSTRIPNLLAFLLTRTPTLTHSINTNLTPGRRIHSSNQRVTGDLISSLLPLKHLQLLRSKIIISGSTVAELQLIAVEDGTQAQVLVLVLVLVVQVIRQQDGSPSRDGM